MDHQAGEGATALAPISTADGTRYYVYDGDLVIGEVTVSGGEATPAVAYTWGANGLVSERFLTGTAYSLWYHFGPQGETRQLTDSMGARVDSYLYTAYGEPVASTGTDRNPFRYGGQAGYYTGPGAGIVLCGARWYNPWTARWLTRDPIGYAGGADLYAYCDESPVGGLDPDGLAADGSLGTYMFSRRYLHDIGLVFKGEVSALNPVAAVKGIYSAGKHIWKNGWSGAKDVGSGMLSGLEFWNKSDPEEAGASFMTGVLLAAPLIKKVPNPTGLALNGPWKLPSGGCTVVRLDVAGRQLGRLDVNPLPVRPRIPARLVGKMLPHIHGRIPGGIDRHWPWEGGPKGKP